MKRWAWIGAGVVITLLSLWIVLQVIPWAYTQPAAGFGERIGPQLSPNQPYQPSKTLWDWMQLLIIPAVLALAAVWFNRGEKRRERERNEDNQREAALQSYLDKMSDLLLKENLRNAERGSEVRVLARSRTLAMLRRLDYARNKRLVRFLQEAALIDGDDPIISLDKAELRGAQLRGADLTGAHLTEANLREADLRGAYLGRASLRGASLQQADLRGAFLGSADLTGAFLGAANLRDATLQKATLKGAFLDSANLTGASLEEADLREAILHKASLTRVFMGRANLSGTVLHRANLSGAYLREADLTGAQVSESQLESARSLSGASLPDGQRMPTSKKGAEPASSDSQIQSKTE
ncbi:MAG: pentapeptide repeat-containing protein [Anaerolineae bacterium]